MNRLLLASAFAAALLPVAASAATAPRSDLFFSSIKSVDTTAHTATLPLHRGSAHGKTVWFIITDASDAAVAKRLGVAYAAGLGSLDSGAIGHATSAYAFDGAPDFSPTRSYVASGGGFPPKSAAPGGIADASYSPFVRIDGMAGIVNAPIIATGDGTFDVTTHRNTEDRVLAIDTKANTVTLALARGFFNGRPVYYLSTEASDPVAAAVERATYTPKLKGVQSGVIPIGVVVNGPQTGSAPQGLAYLALRTPLSSDATAANAATIGSPFNVLSLVPDAAHPSAPNGYSPLWNVVVAGAKQNARITSFASLAPKTSPAGFVVNCPAIAFGDEHSAGY